MPPQSLRLADDGGPTTTIMPRIFSSAARVRRERAAATCRLFQGIPSFPPHLNFTIVLVYNSDKVGLITRQSAF